MSGGALVLLVVVAMGVLTIAIAGVIDYSRALDRERADAVDMRRRLQVAHLVIADLVDHPNPAALSLAHAWLRQEDFAHDPHMVARLATGDRPEDGARR